MAAYTGRFAPSPTGPLHFGSLVSALASYLDARSHQGVWLVRIDDIDPPREVPGAADTILGQLEAHGLLWDGEVIWQSSRGATYDAALGELARRGLLFACDCNRKRLMELGGIYDGRCRDRGLPLDTAGLAWRVRVPDHTSPACFDDLFQGPQHFDLHRDSGDFVLRRKDHLYAYQLATACDEIDFGITHVIRGADLLDSSARQHYLIELLGGHAPVYGHIPAAMSGDGQKLSKQNHARAIANVLAAENLRQALDWLGLPPPENLSNAPVTTLIAWAVAHWHREQVPRGPSRPAPG